MTYGTPMAPSEGRKSAAFGSCSTARYRPRPLARPRLVRTLLAVRETLCDQDCQRPSSSGSPGHCRSPVHDRAVDEWLLETRRCPYRSAENGVSFVWPLSLRFSRGFQGAEGTL
jgi:hypothetical protein